MNESSAVAVEQTAGFTISAVARRLGVAPATLRTWDRRYGVSPSLRTAGAHRRYTNADVALLQRMQALIVSGMPPADAARSAQTEAATPAGPSASRDAADLGEGLTPGAPVQAVPDPHRPPASGASEQRGLSRAATALDTEAAAKIIRRCVSRYGTAWAWDEVVSPVMRAIGRKYEKESAAGGAAAGIDVEHHLSHVIMRELVRHSEVTSAVNTRPVLLASAPDEQHTLPLYALAGALAERSIATRILGGRTPDAALAAAIRRTGPLAVFVWAQGVPSSDLAAAVPTMRPPVAVLVGGPGWQ